MDGQRRPTSPGSKARRRKRKKNGVLLRYNSKSHSTSRRADSIRFHIYCMPTEGRFFHSIRHSLSFLTRLSVSVYLGPPSLLGIPKDEEISIILSESLRVEGSPNRRSSLLLYSRYSRVKESLLLTPNVINISCLFLFLGPEIKNFSIPGTKIRVILGQNICLNFLMALQGFRFI